MELFSLLKNCKKKKGLKTLMKNYYSVEPVQCVICLEDTTQKTLLTPCFHQFCQFCLFQWINVQRFCPVCRQNISKVVFNIVSNVEFDEFNIYSHSRCEYNPVNNDKIYRNYKVYSAVLNNIKQFIELNHHSETQIKLSHFSKALNSSCTLRLTSHFMRCFIYTHDKWKLEKKFGKLRLVTLEFFRDNPVLVERLIDFINFELCSLEFMTKLKVNNCFIQDMRQLLFSLCLKSKKFSFAIENLVDKYYPSYKSFKFARKLSRELLCFASSEQTLVEDYVQNAVYVRMDEQAVIQIDNLVTPPPPSITNKNDFDDVIYVDNSITEAPNQRPRFIDIITLDSGTDSDVKFIEELPRSISSTSNSNKRKKSPINFQSQAHKRLAISHRNINTTEQDISRTTSTSNQPTQSYSRKDYLNMLRILRLSKRSNYFKRILIEELKKKYNNMPTILNAKPFLEEPLREQLEQAWNESQQKPSTSTTSIRTLNVDPVTSSDESICFLNNDKIYNDVEVQNEEFVNFDFINDLCMQQSTSSGYTGLSPNFYPFRNIQNDSESD